MSTATMPRPVPVVVSPVQRLTDKFERAYATRQRDAVAQQAQYDVIAFDAKRNEAHVRSNRADGSKEVYRVSTLHDTCSCLDARSHCAHLNADVRAAGLSDRLGVLTCKHTLILSLQYDGRFDLLRNLPDANDPAAMARLKDMPLTTISHRAPTPTTEELFG